MSVLNLYYDLPKGVCDKIDGITTPVMNVCGAHQYITGEEGKWTVLWFFDDIELYCINIHSSRTGKYHYIKGFRNRRKPDINEQLLYFINELKNTRNSTITIMKKGGDWKRNIYNQEIDDTISGIVGWLPYAILNYINNIGAYAGNTVIECEYDPEYFEHVKDGITNKQYRFLFKDVERYPFYEIPFTDSL